MTNHFNNTRLSVYRSCPRKYFYKYEFRGQGLESTWTNKTLLWGQLFHTGLATLYAYDSVDQAVKAIGQQLAGPDFDDAEDEVYWADEYEYMERLLLKYDEWRSMDDFSVVEIEREGAAPIGDSDYKMVFRCDLVINRGGEIWIMDHKTTRRSLNDLYLDSWRYSPQLWGYCYGHKAASGMDVVGYDVNIIRRLQLDRPSNEGKYFTRLKESWTEDKAARWTKYTLRTINQIESNREIYQIDPTPTWPMNPAECFTYGRCPFLKLCYETNDWKDPHLELLDGFAERTQDYVDTKTLIKEETK